MNFLKIAVDIKIIDCVCVYRGINSVLKNGVPKSDYVAVLCYADDQHKTRLTV